MRGQDGALRRRAALMSDSECGSALSEPPPMNGPKRCKAALTDFLDRVRKLVAPEPEPSRHRPAPGQASAAPSALIHPARSASDTATVTLCDATGRVVGFIRKFGQNRTDYCDQTGRLVVREAGEMTYNASARLVLPGKWGLVVAGANLHISNNLTSLLQFVSTECHRNVTLKKSWRTWIRFSGCAKSNRGHSARR